MADIFVRSSNLKGDLELYGPVIANLIDEIPILAVAGARLDGTLTVRDARELRVKESDRIRSIVDNLRRMGVEVEEYDDGLRLRGEQRLLGASIDSFDDHRIAMAFGVLGALPGNDIRVRGPECVAVSFPGFWEQLARLARR